MGKKHDEQPVDTGERKKFETLEEIKEDLLAAPEPEPPKKKRSRGRPKKETPPPEPAQECPFDTQMMQAGIQLTFGMVAKRAGAHWALTPEEAAQGALVFDALAQKYFPLMGAWAVEINALVWTALIVVPRYMVSVDLKKQRRIEEDAVTE